MFWASYRLYPQCTIESYFVYVLTLNFSKNKAFACIIPSCYNYKPIYKYKVISRAKYRSYWKETPIITSDHYTKATAHVYKILHFNELQNITQLSICIFN